MQRERGREDTLNSSRHNALPFCVRPELRRSRRRTVGDSNQSWAGRASRRKLPSRLGIFSASSLIINWAGRALFAHSFTKRCREGERGACWAAIETSRAQVIRSGFSESKLPSFDPPQKKDGKKTGGISKHLDSISFFFGQPNVVISIDP